MKERFFNHPPGLATLFLTEMWERFSYYGMRALLLLFMVATVEKGGLGFGEEKAGAIYGLYTMAVYLMALPGGWIADNLLGLKRSVFVGGCIITLGHAMLLLPSVKFFFLGLFFVTVGTGMLKPNISSLVGELYSKDENAKRDSGYSLFFLGINIGAFLAPFVTGYFGERINWHYGFGIAGVGMLLGVIQFRMSTHKLPDADSSVERNATLNKKERLIFFSLLAIIFLLGILLFTEVAVLDPVKLARGAIYAITLSAVLYFAYLLTFGNLNANERKNVLTIASFFCTSTVFYFGYEQQGSTLNLFAARYTDLLVGTFVIPGSWFQAVPAVSVLIFAPIFAWLWIWLSTRNISPSIHSKLAFGLGFVGIGYIVMSGAALLVSKYGAVSPYWLIATYLLHTFGEICLYPVGLSAVQKLAPARFSAQLMGIWFLSLAIGNLAAGLMAGTMLPKGTTSQPADQLFDMFSITAAIVLTAGFAIMVIRRLARRHVVRM